MELDKAFEFAVILACEDLAKISDLCSVRVEDQCQPGIPLGVDRLVMVGGSRRFQYGGYWFEFVDPWPVGRYYTDQVYVEHINGGYYLLSPVHPGIQLSISVEL